MAVDKQSLRILGFAFAVGLRCSRPWWAMLLSALAGDAGFVSRCSGGFVCCGWLLMFSARCFASAPRR